MKKTIITLVAIILTIGIIGISFTPQNVLAVVQSDAGGSPAGGGGGSSGGTTSWFSMRLSTILKVSLVNVENNLDVIGNRYYVYKASNYSDSDKYYRVLMNDPDNRITPVASPNEKGKGMVCGEIGGGSYSTNCVNIESKMEITNEMWFLNNMQWGANVSASNISAKLEDADFFAEVVNKLNIQSLLDGQDFDINKLTTEQTTKLKDYRLIVEPVYAMAIYDENGNPSLRFATTKAWAQMVLEKNKGLPAGSQVGLGIYASSLANNVYASNVHGSINKSTNGKPNLPGDAANIYKLLADANGGYGYGVFYIVGGCDPNKQCCYDENGKYHKEFSGTSSNFKCENGEEGKDCTSTLTACKIEPTDNCGTDSGSGPGKLGCNDTNVEFEEIKKEEDVTASRTITKDDGDEHEYYWEEDDYDDTLGNEFCTDDLEQEIKGDVIITQKGNFTSSISPSNIYSGGGFSFNTSYAGNASYELCNKLTYTIKQVANDPKCPSEPTRDTLVGTDEYVDSVSMNSAGKECSYSIYHEKTCYGTEEDENGNEVETSWDCDYYVGTGHADTLKYCAAQEDKVVTCGNGAWETGCSEDNDGDTEYSEAFDTFAKHMADTYLQDPEADEIAQALSKDSNDEKQNGTSSYMGGWNATKDIPEYWYPKEDNKATYELDFIPWLSCINVRTAQVDYFPYKGDSCEDHETETVTYIDGKRLYYVPLKEPDGSFFPVIVDIDKVSIVTKMDWKIDYECGVNCDQNLYNKKGNFKFIYRPIDMSNPFPKIVNENRLIGDNWKTFMRDKKAIESKMNRKENNKEYTVTLTPTLITEIKNYNDNKNYTSLDTIYDSGISDFLKDHNILNLKQNNYNKLGYCTEECWTGLYGGDF